jgi:hypothetical protein
MQGKELITYIDHPELLDSGAVTQLQQLVADFPYFQPAHILLSLASKKWDASIYQRSLKRTAITVTNRSHLFNLIHELEKKPAKEPVKESLITNEQKPVIQVETQSHQEEAGQELDILKAAELTVGSQEEAAHREKEKKEQEDAPAAELEKEIGSRLVNAFVEKEVLNTPELHKPVEPPRAQPESFGDWLAFLKKNNGQPYGQIEEQVNLEKARQQSLRAPEVKELPPKSEPDTRKQKNKAIIDRIIEKNPGLIRTREEQKFYAPEARAKESLLENEHLMTETLARIYALQGNTGKAIRAYEILSLKYPQKSAYFATLIQQLKNNNNQ